MTNKRHIVVVPTIKEPIRPSPGFEKKLLSEHKLDLMALCGFGCRYCSSNAGNYLRINRERFADLTEQQTGRRMYPDAEPGLVMLWPDVLERLRAQLDKKPETWGAGKTLVFSMLTDGFSPELVGAGTTEAVLRLVLERTGFRIRVLTKSAVVGSDKWRAFFSEHPGRFVVGLSIGTLDESWARRIEIGTSSPRARLDALRRLQDDGIPTYGMLCPVFPDVLDEGRLDRLLDAVRPERCEHVWAEPFNDRSNWQAVRDGYELGHPTARLLTAIYGDGETAFWSAYAADLYGRLRARARRDGWTEKLRFLLYEGLIGDEHAPTFAGLEGVLLQSAPGPDGFSRNPHVARMQRGSA